MENLKKAGITTSDKKRLKGVRGLQGGQGRFAIPPVPCKNKFDSYVKITAETKPIF